MNASGSALPLMPYPEAEESVERLMAGRCVVCVRTGVFGKRLWLQVKAGYAGAKRTLGSDEDCWLLDCADLRRFEGPGAVMSGPGVAPCATGSARYYKASSRDAQCYGGPSRTSVVSGEVRRYECVRCGGALVHDGTSNEMWAKVDETCPDGPP